MLISRYLIPVFLHTRKQPPMAYYRTNLPPERPWEILICPNNVPVKKYRSILLPTLQRRFKCNKEYTDCVLSCIRPDNTSAKPLNSLWVYHRALEKRMFPKTLDSFWCSSFFCFRSDRQLFMIIFLVQMDLIRELNDVADVLVAWFSMSRPWVVWIV